MRVLFAIYLLAILSLLFIPAYAWAIGFLNVTITVHDVAVKDVKLSKTVVGQGLSAKINVTVENQGTESETFDVTLNRIGASTTPIGVISVSPPLAPSEIRVLTFTWNTIGTTKGNYTINAVADIVQGETDIADNTFTDGTVKIGVPGDLDGDNLCDLLDLVKLAGRFGKVLGEPEYDPNYDINDDRFIDLLDLVKVARCFGETDP